MKNSKNSIKAFYSKTTKNITRLMIYGNYGKITINVKDLNAEIPMDIFPLLNDIYTRYIYDDIELQYIKDNRSK